MSYNDQNAKHSDTKMDHPAPYSTQPGTLREFASKPAPAWVPGIGDPIDKGALRINEAFVSDISISMSWGQSSSTCSLKVIPDVDQATNQEIWTEPEVGSPIRVCIPNYDGGFAFENQLCFIGIISSIDKSESTGGRERNIKLSDTKELLKNIPVYLNKLGDYSKDVFDEINNITYAYKDGKLNDEPYRNKNGLKIKAIQDAVEDKVYTYYYKSKNINQGYTGTNELVQYKVDMSKMFDKRTAEKKNGEYMLRDGVFDSLDGIDDSTVSSNVNNDYQYRENDTFCSEDFRINGQSKNLLQIIDEAMKGNACDWYVYAYETNNVSSTKTECVINQITIEIRPIPRNDFDQFTKQEFDSFLLGLENVTDSKVFGTELANEESNKAFFGPPYEYYQAISGYKDHEPTFKQFWGFKRPDFDEEKRKFIIDKYGQKIEVKGEINENPTFDTDSMVGVVFKESVVTKEELKDIAINGAGYSSPDDIDDIEDKTEKELETMLTADTTFDKQYTFDLDDKDQKYAFEILKYSYKDVQTFVDMLNSTYLYVDFWERNKDEKSYCWLRDKDEKDESKATKDVTGRIYNITFCGKSVSAGSVVTIPATYEGDISLEFSHRLLGEDARGSIFCDEDDYNDPDTMRRLAKEDKSKKTIRVTANNMECVSDSFTYSVGKNEFTKSVVTRSYPHIMKNNSTAFELADAKKALNTMFFGLYRIRIEVEMVKYKTPSHADAGTKKQARALTSYYDIWVKYFPTYGNQTVNPYEKMAEMPTYKWAKALLVNLLQQDSGRLVKGVRRPNPLKEVLKNFYKINNKTENEKEAALLEGRVAQYANWQVDKLFGRIQQLHGIVASYLDSLLGKKYYRRIRNKNWIIADEAWDGTSGLSINNPSVRGKFMNKQNGKMPCLYKIENIKGVNVEPENDGLLFIYNKNDATLREAYGTADCRQYVVGVEEPKTEAEEEEGDKRYAIVTLNGTLQRREFDQATMSVNYDDALKGTKVEGAVREFVSLLNEARKSTFGLVASDSSIGIAFCPVDVFELVPDAFYIPTLHSYIKYGPWILDYRRNNSASENRANFGVMTIEDNQDLNPWSFESYEDVNQFIIMQYENAVMTEYRMNRGQVSCGDIPRFNIGQKIGKYSNISSMSINYAIGGITTTYTLTAFGAGKRVREERQTDHILNRMKNIEDKINLTFNFLNKEDYENTVQGKEFFNG